MWSLLHASFAHNAPPVVFIVLRIPGLLVWVSLVGWFARRLFDCLTLACPFLCILGATLSVSSVAPCPFALGRLLCGAGRLCRVFFNLAQLVSVFPFLVILLILLLFCRVRVVLLCPILFSATLFSLATLVFVRGALPFVRAQPLIWFLWWHACLFISLCAASWLPPLSCCTSWRLAARYLPLRGGLRGSAPLCTPPPPPPHGLTTSRPLDLLICPLFWLS